VTALEIFQVLEAAHRKGFLPLNASDVDVLSAQGTQHRRCYYSTLLKPTLLVFLLPF
jgi:hypothetical protein